MNKGVKREELNHDAYHQYFIHFVVCCCMCRPFLKHFSVLIDLSMIRLASRVIQLVVSETCNQSNGVIKDGNANVSMPRMMNGCIKYLKSKLCCFVVAIKVHQYNDLETPMPVFCCQCLCHSGYSAPLMTHQLKMLPALELCRCTSSKNKRSLKLESAMP